MWLTVVCDSCGLRHEVTYAGSNRVGALYAAICGGMTEHYPETVVEGLPA